MEIPKEFMERLWIPKVRQLAFKNDREYFFVLAKLFFQDAKNDSFGHGVDALPNRSRHPSCLGQITTHGGGLTTTANAKISEGLFIGPAACASGLRHIQFPNCAPIRFPGGGQCALSSRSVSCVWSTTTPSGPSDTSIRMLFALISSYG